MGNLFDRDLPEISAVKKMIEVAVAEYIDALPHDPDHIFLKRRSAEFRFSGSWSVRLRREGFHLNHVHSEGWISSCYYVGLPGSTTDEVHKERSEEHTSELQSLMRISYAVFCLKKKNTI